MSMATCCFCGSKMIWQSDFDFSDYGREDNGVVSVYECSHCGASAEFSTKPEEENEDEI